MSTALQKQPVRDIEAMDDSDLPEGWTEIELGDHVYVAGRIGWRGLKAEEYTPSGPILLSVPSLNYGNNVEFSSVNHISQARYDESPEIQLKVGDTLLVKDGAGIGKLGFVAHLPGKSTVNSSLLVVRPNNALLAHHFLFYYLKGPQFQKIALERITGSGTPHLFQRDIKKLRVLVPPVSEQHSIVAKVEELLGQVNAVRARLAKAAQILKRFRQSVLAAACSGRLTEDWRVKEGLDLDNWQDVVLSEVADMRLGKMLDQAKNVGTPTPYLRNVNVRWFAFDLDHLFSMRATKVDKKELDVRNGDLFVCEGGEPGRCAVWNFGPTDIIFQKAVHRIRLNENVSPDWLAFNMKHNADSGALEELFTGSGIRHLTGRSLATYTFHVPLLKEQHEIVRRVGALFKLADEIEAQIYAATKRADKLTQAILAKAFRGELVPTEAELARREGRDYETAFVLLQRIKAQRTVTDAHRGSRRNTTRAKKRA